MHGAVNSLPSPRRAAAPPTRCPRDAVESMPRRYPSPVARHSFFGGRPPGPAQLASPRANSHSSASSVALAIDARSANRHDTKDIVRFCERQQRETRYLGALSLLQFLSGRRTAEGQWVLRLPVVLVWRAQPWKDNGQRLAPRWLGAAPASHCSVKREGNIDVRPFEHSVVGS
jgi:hypothetical protein